MMKAKAEEKQPWVTCFFTDILLTHMEETFGKRIIDCPNLFKGIEGFETPPDPESFLRDVHNWVPLSVLRELLWQCENISGKKDIAYRAARAYFDPSKKQLPSLFEIIARVLNDVRSVLIYVNLWAAVQTNYLRLQAFEDQDTRFGLHILAQFQQNARPTVGTMRLLRGIAEGFPRLYSFIEDVQCIDEFTQSRIEDIVREFPGFTITVEEDRLFIRRRESQQSIVEAIKVPLKSEVIPVSHEFAAHMLDTAVVPLVDCRINVLTRREETDSQRRGRAPWAYKIVKPGDLDHNTFSYSFLKDHIFNAPYSRLRFLWKEQAHSPRGVSVEHVRKEVSQLLFAHLKQIKQTQVRMIQYNIEKRKLTLENIYLRRVIEREFSFAGIIGKSEKIQNLIDLTRSIAETDVTVLIQGETGTGKELIAKAIHYNSPRRKRRFVAINCGSLSETLLESELFGHERGAFTGAITQRKGIFEFADGGTIFFDEIGEIAPSTQVKLLRVLQESEFQRVGDTEPIRVDVRVVAATNQNLEELITKGRFRPDLYYRLHVVPITIPPLRERADDIPLLVSHFIEKSSERMSKSVKRMSPHALALLMAYSWPGNVRELENVIQWMIVVAKGEILDVQDLPPEIYEGKEGLQGEPKDLKGIARESTGMVEKNIIVDALAKTGGNVSKASRALGISRATLQTKMKTYGLRGPTR